MADQQIWVHVYCDNFELYRTVPVVSFAAADSVAQYWENAGFDTEIETCPDH